MQISDEGVLVLTDEQLRRHVASPQNLPAAPEGQLHPEQVRRAYANHYADLQKFKLKVVVVLVGAALVMKLHIHWYYVLGALAWLYAVSFFSKKALAEEKSPPWEQK